ncbi:UNVERIFIED_CONTAM: hypothetical protein FKN15_078167 [Acipenser sinensis]
MVKVSFNSALAQKDAKKEEEKSETLIIPEDKDPEDVIHIRHQSKTWCWCMCLGLALMLSGLVVGGAYLYRYFMYPRLTAYLDLSLNRCYVIPLNTSIVMPPRDFLELLINIKAGTYLPQSYLIHEQMIVTDRIENVDQLGYFIYNLCRGKETYRLQRRDAIRGIQKREALNCHTIRHFENRFAVETVICEK